MLMFGNSYVCQSGCGLANILYCLIDVIFWTFSSYHFAVTHKNAGTGSFGMKTPTFFLFGDFKRVGATMLDVQFRFSTFTYSVRFRFLITLLIHRNQAQLNPLMVIWQEHCYIFFQTLD